MDLIAPHVVSFVALGPYWQHEAIQALRELVSAELTFRPTGEEGVRIRVEGTFRRASAAKKLADFLNVELGKAKAMLEAQAGQIPEPMKPMLKKARAAMDAVRISSDGAMFTARASLEELPVAELFLGFMMPFAMMR